MPGPLPQQSPSRRTRVIAIGNQKGGVAKTTNCVHLAAALAEMGRKCLIIDLDMNRGTTRQFKIPSDSFAGSFEVLLGEEDPLDVVVTSEDEEIHLPENVHVICARRDLEKVDQALASKNKFVSPQDALLEPIRRLRGHYDYVFLDTAPNATAPTLAAYKVADYFLLTAMPSPFSISGLQDALQDIQSAREHGNPDLQLLGVILSCIDQRTKIAQRLREFVDKTFSAAAEHSRQYDTTISRSVVIEEAQEVGRTVFEYDPQHKIVHQFRALVREMEERLEELENETSSPATAPALEVQHG